MRILVKLAKNAVKSVDQFWFKSENYPQMRLFRSLFGLTMLAIYAVRSLDLKLFFSENGIMNAATWPEALGMDNRFTLLRYVTSDGGILALHTFYLAMLLLFVLGVWPRLVSILCFILHVSFIRRNLTIVYGVDAISTYFFFYFIFADFRSEKLRDDLLGWLGSAVFRLCQIQVCIIYFFSGFEKVKGQMWWHGVALWEVLANYGISRWDMSFLAHWPGVIYVMTFSTILWEAYFPALVWVKRIRYPLLLLGVMLHLGISTMLILPFFGTLMIVTYSLFLEPRHAAFLQQKVLKSLKWPQVLRTSAEEHSV